VTIKSSALIEFAKLLQRRSLLVNRIDFTTIESRLYFKQEVNFYGRFINL